jgi:peptide/nickel transport system permease protein
MSALKEKRTAVHDAHPIARLFRRRIIAGVVTMVLVSMVVFSATEVLPGNAAYAVLGRTASPERVRALQTRCT